MEIQKLTNRILEISRKNDLSHVGSCLSVLPLLIEIYENKAPEDLVVLDGAHSHLAHLVVMEELLREGYELGMGSKFDAEEKLKEFGIHCDRRAGGDVSGGSLGHCVGISIGLAEAGKRVYCVITDGSLMEGSNWEALRILKERNSNIQIYANFNGYTAVAEINRIELGGRLLKFCPTARIYHTKNGEGFDGVQGHYEKAK